MNNEKQTPKPKLTWLWWVVLIGLVAWNAYILRPSGREDTSLPYSMFVAQVRADNVSQVSIAGNQITGAFKKPFTWSNPVPAGAPAGANTPNEPATHSSFRTTFPDTVGDPNLMALLNDHQVTVEAAPPATPWLTILLTYGLPIILLIAVVMWMGRRASQSQSGIFNFGQSKARRYMADRPGVTFSDVAGADEAKRDLEEVVDFLKNPQKYHALGARIPRGVLLVGPPGTGKTLLAKAVAGEAHVPFFSISASEFVEMFVGVGASRVRDLFEQAKVAAPGIVFIDELDAVGRRRGAGLGTVNDEREQTLNQLLVEMDGFDDRHEVIILAATNRPDVLDPALLRPGRFDRQVTVGAPDRKGREAILRIHTQHLQLGPEVDLGLLARTTTGFSGADLANLCNEAALVAARNNRRHVTFPDFEEALDKVLLGGVRPLLLDPHDRKVVAYHEAGHALVAWLSPNADPVHKITIIPHGRALGVTEQLPGEDRYNYSRTYLKDRLAVMLGGRVAEQIVLGDITTGAENDLVEATKLSRNMVTRWGMGSVEEMAFQTNEEQPFLGYELSQGREYSEQTAVRIDQDVQDMLAERHSYVYRLLSASREPLERLVEALLQDETIGSEQLKQILGPRPEPAMETLQNA